MTSTCHLSRRTLLSLGPCLLASCATQSVWSSDADIEHVRYTSPQGPRRLTLYTMRNNESENGAHTSLLIDASQRVLFDPAGSFEHPDIPERNDVLFGISEAIERYYVSYHARETYHVIGQSVLVPHETAERALELALKAGPVSQALCTRATSSLISQLPGFEHIGVTWFPNTLSDDFSGTTGVETRLYVEDDSDDKSIAAQQHRGAIRHEIKAAARSK